MPEQSQIVPTVRGRDLMDASIRLRELKFQHATRAIEISRLEHEIEIMEREVHGRLEPTDQNHRHFAALVTDIAENQGDPTDWKPIPIQIPDEQATRTEELFVCSS